jgi:hypothetical protein
VGLERGPSRPRSYFEGKVADPVFFFLVLVYIILYILLFIFLSLALILLIGFTMSFYSKFHLIHVLLFFTVHYDCMYFILHLQNK